MPDAAIHGYVLSGGQSSRMGTDKALLPFGSSTLLDRAVVALQLFCLDVTLVGRLLTSEQHCRAIPDHVTAKGPVAGVEAALTDLAARDGTWAFFLPVDLPLLPGELLRALATHWLSNPFTRVAFPIADGTPQPVVSLVHVTALPSLQRSLALDQRRLRPALETAVAQLADELALPRGTVLRTPVLTIRDGVARADELPLGWRPSQEELRLASLWFANANTPGELDQLRRALADSTVAI